LEHDRGHSAEMAGPALAFERHGDRPDVHVGLEPGGIDLLDGGGEEEVAAGPGEKVLVAVEVPRVAGQVLGRSELFRVDEDARRDVTVLASRALDERRVSGMQVTHGGDQTHVRARGQAPGSHLFDRGHCLHASVSGETGRPSRLRTSAYRRSLTGTGIRRRLASRMTAPLIASISVRAPRSRSWSIEERLPAVRRA